MTSYTITTTANLDSLTGKTGNDTYTVNGGTLTIDGDSRYEQNAPTLANSGMSNITISATLGGNVEFDARFCRLIPFDAGSGTVPAAGTVISGGGASGKLICVLSSLTTAPLTAGAAMPATGWVKIKQWNGTTYADNTALSGITATVNGTDSVGWLSLVARENQIITGARLGLFRFRGEWLEIGTTSGSRSTTYQIPTAGEAVYQVGVQVETSTPGVYEWYPNADPLTALEANIGTEPERGKFCWITSAGVVRLGSDGTNSTGGFLPPSGRKIRIPNLFLHNCTTAIPAVNALPNTTLSTRYRFSISGGRAILDKVNCAWYINLLNPYETSLTDSTVNDAGIINTPATSVTFSRNCVSHTGTQNNLVWSFNNMTAGALVEDNVFARYQSSSSTQVVAIITADQYVSRRNTYRSTALRTSGAAVGLQINALRNSLFENEVFIGAPLGGGFSGIQNCDGVTFNNTVYIDRAGGFTGTTLGYSAIQFGSPGAGNANMLFDGFSIGLARTAPAGGILSLASNNGLLKFRNFGSRANPLLLGGAPVRNVSYTRVGSTFTITSPNHQISGSATGFILANSGGAGVPANVTPGNRATLTVVDANTLTIAGAASGPTSGTLDYMEVQSSDLISFGSTNALSDCKFQRMYSYPARTASPTDFRGASRITFENVGSAFSTFSALAADTIQKGSLYQPSTGANASVYGNHFIDAHITSDVPNRTGLSWSRSGTTATVTSVDHGLINSDSVTVTVSSDTSAVALGIRSTINVLTKDTFEISATNAGATTGTLTLIPHNAMLVIRGNESTTTSAPYVSFTAGTPQFTGAGEIAMPTVGDQVVYEWNYFIKGHSQFVPTESFIDNVTAANFSLEYQIDQGSGFSAWRSLQYVRTGSAGSTGSTTVTMTDTTGVQANDYIFGAGIGAFAQVVSVNSATSITVSIPNSGTVNDPLRFNRLPLETIASPSVGFKLRVRITTLTAGTNSWRNIRIPTASTAVDRDFLYTLDTSQLTLTNVVVGSRVRITKVSNGELLVNTSIPSTTYTVALDFAGDIQIELRKATIAPFYKPYTAQTTLSTTVPVSLVVSQERDDI